MTDDAARQLGALLTATEAGGIADRIADGQSLGRAVAIVDGARRASVRSLLGCCDAITRGAVLRAVQGARSSGSTQLDPLWTMPGHLARHGPLTSSVAHLVDHARSSITCSTYNVQRTSSLWDALVRSVARPEISLRLYVDTNAADKKPTPTSPTTAAMAAELWPGLVFRTRPFDGVPVRNHAKFLVVDHRFLLVTSANLSWSAEYRNVELGVLVDNPQLAEQVERDIHDVEGSLYEHVRATAAPARSRPPERTT